MKRKVKEIFSHPLISGSFLLIAGGVLANIFNFLFNLFMSRNLLIEDYGTLVSLIAIITLLSVPAGAVAPTIVTLAGNYFAENNTDMVRALYYKTFKMLLIIGVFLLIFFTLFSGIVGNFFNISDRILLPVTAIAILGSYIYTVNNSFFQAKLSFRLLTVLNVSSSISKVVFGAFLVLVGFGLGGAVVSYLLSYLIPIGIGIFFLKKVISNRSGKKSHISYRELVEFGIPSSVVIFCLNSLVTTDILLVKHLFSLKEAGIYAGLSLVGRVIFYITAPITTVMFPILIARFKNGQSYKNILYMALFMITGISMLVTFFYFLFPKFTILFFLKKEEYLVVSQNLGMFGIFITLYSLISVFSYYFLSIKKTRISILLVGAAVLQAVLIYFFHTSFQSIINISIIVSTLLLIGFVIFYKISPASK